MGAAKNRGLGKGLEALFNDSEIHISEVSVNKDEGNQIEGITFVNINDIKPNTNQPRKDFDEEKLNELATSIKEHGLIQPVILRRHKTGYELVAGERRWRACRKAALKEIPCIIKDLTDEENMLVTIIENVQREDLNPIEEAEGFNQMIVTYGLTQEMVSKSVGKSRPHITNTLRLLKLPEKVKGMVSSGALSAGHVRALAGIKDEQRQIELASHAASEGLSVREMERLAKQAPKKRVSRRKSEKNADVKKVEEDLKTVLGTKVSLKENGEKGKIEIDYYSREELERLIELLKTLG